MDFIDTHLHLIHRDRLGYAWTQDIPALASGDFTVADWQGLVAGRGVVGALVMECGVDDADYRAEARWAAGLAGILGQIASCRPEEAGFDDWLAECTGLRVRGFRRILHVMPDDLSAGAEFRANLRKIGVLGLTFDMCFQARQLEVAVDLARACDDQVLVLDHCGVPDIAGGAFEDWAAGITALAGLPHVMVKLSGIAAYCGSRGASAAVLRPWVAHVIDSFGPGRIVWGSDWPVVNLGPGLPDWIDTSRALLADLSADEQVAIAQGNARRIYRLD